MAKGITQKDKVIHYITTYGSITPIEAYANYTIMRLASVINKLKQPKNGGYKIKTVIEKGFNRDGETVHYARYSFEEEGD